jgi:hypothetical protein
MVSPITDERQQESTVLALDIIIKQAPAFAGPLSYDAHFLIFADYPHDQSTNDKHIPEDNGHRYPV